MDETQATVHTATLPDSDLARRVQEELGQNVYLCYQCVKCTSGCPVGEFFDWQPNQIMRAVQLGVEEVALHAKTPWLCAACQTCTTRCPQGLDVNAIMEFLARESLRQGIQPSVSEVKIFNEAFMHEVRLWGRAYELGLIAELKLRTKDLTSDLDLGIKMIQKNKLPFLPTPTRHPRKTGAVSARTGAIAYYPGCSLHSSAREYDLSTQKVCSSLGIDLVEPKGWVCCGSSAAHRSDPAEALRLPMENLALVESSGFHEVVMPCAACFNRHKVAQHEIRSHPESKKSIDQAIGYAYQDKVEVVTLMKAILTHAGKAKVSESVKKPLKGLRVVSYYGCLLTRSPQVTGADHPENPTELDEILSTLGADVRDWSYKTVCCGAAHSLTRPDIVHKLSKNLILKARLAGADAIAVACPLCHTNLDARQFQMDLDEPLPVFFFTQLMALAFGLPEKAAALDRNLVDPRPFLQAKGLLEAV